MNPTDNTLLVVAGPEPRSQIKTCLAQIPGLDWTTAESEKDFFERIYTHRFALIVIDQGAGIDIQSMGLMLNSHRKIHNPPVLILADSLPSRSFFADFKHLYIDCLISPFDSHMLVLKIKLLHEFSLLKAAVAQSAVELDNAYQQVLHLHDAVVDEQVLIKRVSQRVLTTSARMQQPLRGMWAGISRLHSLKELPEKSKSALSTIKNCTQTIELLSKQEGMVLQRMEPQDSSEQGLAQTRTILCAEKSNEFFAIFNHLIRGVLPSQLFQTKSIDQSLSLLAGRTFDLIVVSDSLSDGTGLELLSRLRQLHPDIPVVFSVNRVSAEDGPKAVSKGALSYFVKEEICGDVLFSTISGTLSKARIIQAAKDSRDKIISISQKDSLTRLYTPGRFDQELAQEISKSKRYRTRLSLIVIQIDRFYHVQKTKGQGPADHLVATLAALVQRTLRESDIICRYKTDQFAILLPHTDKKGARILARRIRDLVADHDSGFSVNTGLSEVDEQTDSRTALIVKAINHLNTSKEKTK